MASHQSRASEDNVAEQRVFVCCSWSEHDQCCRSSSSSIRVMFDRLKIQMSLDWLLKRETRFSGRRLPRAFTILTEPRTRKRISVEPPQSADSFAPTTTTAVVIPKEAIPDERTRCFKNPSQRSLWTVICGNPSFHRWSHTVPQVAPRAKLWAKHYPCLNPSPF